MFYLNRKKGVDMEEEEFEENSLLAKLSNLAETNDQIDPDLYQKYDVKRGLRYADGREIGRASCRERV